MSWRIYLASKARRSHRIMIGCGIVIYPAFGLLDYLTIAEWKLFLLVRLAGALVLAGLLIIDYLYTIRSEILAHISTQVVLSSLMWMLSYIDSPSVFSIYAINTCTGFIASAIFLLWRPIHSVILLSSTLCSFIIFNFIYSNLSAYQIVSSGTLVLFTTALMSQFYIYFRYKITSKDFRTQAYLNRINSDLRIKNSTIEQQSNEIMIQNDSLEKLNDLKNKLLMVISHDFRSPLQSLKGILDLLDKSVHLSPQEISSLTKGIKAKVDVTSGFLENILFWSRSQINGEQFNPVTINMFGLAHEACDLLQATAELKNISINNNIDPNHFINADEDMVRLVMRNLLANAIKYSHNESIVSVFSKLNGNEIIVSVRDTGVGLSAIDADKLFASTPNDSKKGTFNERGTGLGLMLCQKFVKRNMGEIWVESEPEKGSTFSFSVPSAQYINVLSA
jgi:signal transduction histidine kinase